MNTKEAVKSLQEYVNVPLAELVESSTNPRKTFDDERLEELLSAVTVLAFIHDLNIVAVRIKHPGRIIARIVFETSLR